MVLTPEQIEEIVTDWFSEERAAARAIKLIEQVEVGVRKQDELIRNFVAAIKLDRHDWEDWPEDSRKAFEALRARLEDKP